MIKFYIFIGIVVGVALVVKFFSNNSSEKEEAKKKPLYKYNRKDFLISRPEHEFFNILVEIAGNQYQVFTQVHLPTILDHKVVGQNWKGSFSHINGKSVDFVICEKSYLKPLLAIELDDKSHDRFDRIERDSEVERMLQEAGMPLLRFSNNGSFNKEEVGRLVLEKLK
jgi:very-short-patch-repair endonuclease